jgi:O-antigen/teichoic acid export membrane protein
MRWLGQEQVNALVNITAKVAVGLVPLVFVPVYVRAVGMHGYGVFAYALTLVGLSSIFDFGLSPAVTRAFSQPANAGKRATIFKTFERTYLGVGLVLLVAGAVLLGFFAKPVSHGATSIWAWAATAALLACSWPVSLYSGALLGADQQIRLNVIVFAGVLARFVSGAVLLYAFGPDPSYLLLGQAAGFLMTAWFLRRAVRSCSPPEQPAAFAPSVIRGNLGFAAKTWIIVGIGVVCAQLDKQVIATAYGLAIFSSYSIAWTLSAAATNIAHPIGSSYFPRSVAAFEAGDTAYLQGAVGEALGIVTLLILAPCAVAASFASDVLALWLGQGGVAPVEIFLVPLLYAAQLGAICALAQSFLTSFGRVGVIVVLNVLQLAVMAAGMAAAVTLRSGSAEAIAYLWIAIQAAGAVTGVYLVARAINISLAGSFAAIGAAVAAVNVGAWASHAALSHLALPGLVRLVLAGLACCAIGAMFVFAQRIIVAPGAGRAVPGTAARQKNEGAENS